MDSSSQKQKQDDVMEVPEIHGDLLIELLDASLAAENAGHQLALVADVVDDDCCWIESQENYGIHAHQDCEDCCGLDGILLPEPDFDDGTLELEWAETADAAAMGPFASECTGDWYMDGLAMAMEMEWEEQDDGGSGFPFEPCYGGGEAEQVYPSPFPLWE